MKAFKPSVFLAAGLTAMTLCQGCAVLLVGGAAGGATYGSVEHVNNTLQMTPEVSLDKAWSAANAVLKEQQMPVKASKKDAKSGRLVSRNDQNQRVTIEMTRKEGNLTEIQISVGAFDNAQNLAEEEEIYYRMRSHFLAGG
jgi:hypothetical protein